MRNSDKSNFYQFICDFPNQIEKSPLLVKKIRSKIKNEDIHNIVIAGMGGSAIAGDLLKAFLYKELRIPLIINRLYQTPRFTNHRTLFIACSYSGNTEETLTAFTSALNDKAQIIGIASGGKLEEMCKNHQKPFIKIPGKFPPRQALGYLFFPLLHLFEKLGFISIKISDIRETLRIVKGLRERNHPQITQTHNFCNHIAQNLYNKIPIIYTASEHLEPVVTRWRNQFNENAKVLSFSNVFPELNHNEIMGWEASSDLLQQFSVVLLRDLSEFPRNKRRMEITKNLLQQKHIPIFEIFGEGDSLLSRMISIIYIGDWVSYYLALLYDKDPYTIQSIDYLKETLSHFEEETEEK